jgi:BTB/POZ domain
MSNTSGTERPENTPPTPYGPPFDDPDADTILRTSDQVDFHVYRVILSKASPIFRDMVSPRQRGGTGATSNPRNLFDLPENSKTLASLLSAIYPLAPVLESDKIRSLEDHLTVIEAARKYDMAAASLHLLKDFENSAWVRDSPVEAFCAAYTLQLGEAAQVAAKASLKHRLNLDNIGNSLENTTGPALFQLWEFHRSCSIAAVTTISGDNLTWVTPAQGDLWKLARIKTSWNCNCDRRNIFVGPPGSGTTWGSHWYAHASWSNYITRAHNALREHPCSKAVTHEDILNPSYKESMCSECRQSIFGLPEFSRQLGEEVDRCVAEVRTASTYLLGTSLNVFWIKVQLELPF